MQQILTALRSEARTLFILAVIAILFVLFQIGCATVQTQKTDTGATVNTKVDPNLYHLAVQLENQDSYEIEQSTFYLYDTYARGITWTDGKGLLRGELLAVDPSVDWAQPERTIVVKTTDRKITAMSPGDIVELTCVADFEPVCGWSQINGVEGTCEDVWEFDFCRMRGFQSEDQADVKAIPNN